MRYGIIADDLTGSLDVAGSLVRLGYRPVVRVSPGSGGQRRTGFPVSLHASDVLILNTRTRDSSIRQSAAGARTAAADLERLGFPVAYQKIDSTLRGHWAEALGAIARVVRPHQVLICPAFPALGRFVRGGRLWLAPKRGGRRACPSPPEPGSDLRAILRGRCGWRADLIGLETVRKGPAAVRSAAERQPTAAHPGFVVLDAEADCDLRSIGRALRSAERRLLWVGSAGLARYVFPRCPVSEGGKRAGRRFPWLLVQGSRQPTSHEQFDLLENRECIHFLRFALSEDRRKQESWIDTALTAFDARRNVAIIAPREFDSHLPARFTLFLDRLLQRISAHHRLAGVFVTGGNTAEAVCDSLRIRTHRVVEEIRPGIPLSRALDGRLPGLQLVTKAGGFGGPREVLRVFERCVRG